MPIDLSISANRLSDEDRALLEKLEPIVHGTYSSILLNICQQGLLAGGVPPTVERRRRCVHFTTRLGAISPLGASLCRSDCDMFVVLNWRKMLREGGPPMYYCKNKVLCVDGDVPFQFLQTVVTGRGLHPTNVMRGSADFEVGLARYLLTEFNWIPYIQEGYFVKDEGEAYGRDKNQPRGPRSNEYYTLKSRWTPPWMPTDRDDTPPYIPQTYVVMENDRLQGERERDQQNQRGQQDQQRRQEEETGRAQAKAPPPSPPDSLEEELPKFVGTPPPGWERYLQTTWPMCQSPSDFEVWTDTYDEFGDEIPFFFPWEGITASQRKVLKDTYAVHSLKDWYQREESGFAPTACYLLTRATKKILLDKARYAQDTGRLPPERRGEIPRPSEGWRDYFSFSEQWVLQNLFNDNEECIVYAVNTWHELL